MKAVKKVFIVTLIMLLCGCSNNSEPSGKVVDNSGLSENSQLVEEEKEVEKITVKKGETKNIKTKYGDTDYEFDINFVDSFYCEEVHPPKPQDSYYSYYQDVSGEKYVVYEFTVKNLSSESISDYIFENFLGDECTHKFKAGGKYEYTGFFVMVEGDSNRGHDLTTLVYVNPLATETMYYIVSVPDDAVSMSWDCNICAGEKEIIFK